MVNTFSFLHCIGVSICIIKQILNESVAELLMFNAMYCLNYYYAKTNPRNRSNQFCNTCSVSVFWITENLALSVNHSNLSLAFVCTERVQMSPCSILQVEQLLGSSSHVSLSWSSHPTLMEFVSYVLDSVASPSYLSVEPLWLLG